MADLISREALLRKYCKAEAKGDCSKCEWQGDSWCRGEIFGTQIDAFPSVDAVEVATLESWLYEIAMNNIGAPVADTAEACEEIISRLGGLRKFAEERREENAAD